MLTRDEVIQLILYLVIATALLLATRVRAEIPAAGETPSKCEHALFSVDSALRLEHLCDVEDSSLLDRSRKETEA
jgi:hypothetical protein